MHAVRHNPVVGNILLAEQSRRARENATFGVGRHAACDHQPNTAARTRRVEFSDTVPIAGLFQTSVHRAHQHAILQRGVAKI